MTEQGRTIAPEAPPRPRPGRPEPAPAPRRTPSRVERRARLRARRRRRLRRLAVLVGAVALAGTVASVGPALVGKGFRTLVPADSGGPPPVREPSSVLLAWPLSDGGGAVVVLLGVDPEQDRAGALLVPAHTQVEVPSLGSKTFADTLDDAGGTSLALALENAAGVDVGRVVTLDRPGLRSVLGPAGTLPARLREPVVVGQKRYGAGDQRLSTSDAVRLLTEREPDADDFEHLVAVHAVLEAWLAGLSTEALEATQAALAERGGLEGEALDEVVALLRSLAGSDVSFATLSVRSLGLPEERYSLDEAKVAPTVHTLFPGLLFPGGADRPKVEILNGSGVPGLAGAVTERVVPHGYRVVLTGNAAQFGLEETLVVLQDERLRREAERLVEILGTGEIRMARNPVSLVDVSLVIGSDFDPGGG